MRTDADTGSHEIKKAIDDNLLYAKGLLQDQWNRVRNKVKQQVEVCTPVLLVQILANENDRRRSSVVEDR